VQTRDAHGFPLRDTLPRLELRLESLGRRARASTGYGQYAPRPGVLKLARAQKMPAAHVLKQASRVISFPSILVGDCQQNRKLISD
jgi:hypothetical protein